MISSSSNEIIVLDEKKSPTSVQSVLFNSERRLPPSSSESVPLAALSTDESHNTTRNNNFLRQNHILSNTTIHSQNQHPSQPKLLSRNPKVILTSSTRGNLGPPTVLNQDPPGTDWIKDRWQAASDMHGTAIKGSHWVLLDFSQLILDIQKKNEMGSGKDGVVDGRSGIQMTKIVLDWETAFATDYRVEGRMDRPLQYESSLARGVDREEEEDWCVLYDGGKQRANGNNHKRNNKLQDGIDFHESEYGQSPGVKQKLPLHILHTIEWTAMSSNNEQSSEGNGKESSSGSCSSTTSKFRYLRVFIRKPARGWGVSLWQVDVYGTIVMNE